VETLLLAVAAGLAGWLAANRQAAKAEGNDPPAAATDDPPLVDDRRTVRELVFDYWRYQLEKPERFGLDKRMWDLERVVCSTWGDRQVRHLRERHIAAFADLLETQLSQSQAEDVCESLRELLLFAGADFPTVSNALRLEWH
jgi:hypothetical protein